MNPLQSDEIKKIINEQLGWEPDGFLLDCAWETITEYIGYSLSLATETEMHTTCDSKYVFLDRRPLKRVLELQINGSTIETYTQNKDSIIFPVLPAKGLDVKITYEAGYTADDMPSSIVLAAILIIKSIEHSSSDDGNLKSYKLDTLSYQFKDSVETSREIKSYLNRFRSM